MTSTTYTQTALITGANQGIGFEIAKLLATEHKDFHVILAARRQDALDEAVGKLAALGLDVSGLVLDLASDESIAHAAQIVEEKHGRLDALVNNAAISTASDGLSTREAWHQIYDTNVVGTLAVTDAFLPLLAKSQAPAKRIVMVSSSLGSITYKMDPNNFNHKVEWPPYTVSKTALNMLTAHYIQRHEDDPTWKINLHCPGYCKTNLNSYQGFDDPAGGAVGAVRFATLGLDGETGAFIGKEGKIPW